MPSPEKCSLTSVLISPGGKADKAFVAMLAEATGSLVTCINHPDQLSRLGDPAIIASNGLGAPQIITDNAGVERLEYPIVDAEGIAAQKGCGYVGLAPSRLATLFAILGENVAYLMGRDDYVVPTYCSPKIAKRRIQRIAKTMIGTDSVVRRTSHDTTSHSAGA